MTALTNWSNTITFSTGTLHRPTSLDQLCELIASSTAVRALGTGHSFNRIADTAGTLVSIRDLSRTIEVDAATATVRVGGGVRYGELTAVLDEAGFALANLGSLPHISVAGACATGTHGSGSTNQVLAAAVRAFTLVTADGAVIRLSRDGTADFDGAVIALGSLGVVTELTLALVPTFQVWQYVYDGLPLAELTENLAQITDSAYSVSLFTRWQNDRIDQAWLKSRQPRPAGEPFFGAVPADGPRHPVPGGDPGTATRQLGEPGPWQQRLPHFRLEFTPSNGDEIQSEYFVAREHAVAAIEAVNAMAAQLDEVLQVGEVRTVATDELWLSPSYRTDRVALHFTWIADAARVEPVVAELERRLAALNAVPHWAKLFTHTPAQLAALHPRLADFAALARRYDPSGKFANDFVRTYVFG